MEKSLFGEVLFVCVCVCVWLGGGGGGGGPWHNASSLVINLFVILMYLRHDLLHINL